jgi:hypothetical protein
MEVNSKTSYQAPVDKLLTYGESHLMAPDEWPDYRELGIGPEHIPDLIQMATDEEVAQKRASERLLPPPSAGVTFSPNSFKTTHKEKASHKKAKNKMAKLSRKKNRKR